MTTEIYLFLRFTIATILLVVGAGLTFGILPKGLRNTVFDSSRRIMGAAIMTLPIVTILSYTLGIMHINPELSALLYLTSFYVITVLTSISFVSLLGDRIKINSLRFMRAIVGCAIYPVPLALTIVKGDATLVRAMSLATSIMLVITITHECITFFVRYKRAVVRVNNYYSDDLEVNIKWLRNSALLMLSLGIVCSVSILVGPIPMWAGLMITLYRALIFIYTFYAFIKFITSFVERRQGVESEDESPMVVYEQELRDTCERDESDYVEGIGHEVTAAIAMRLSSWIGELGYTQRGVTINSVSRDIMTNRTYLSTYINTKYSCSFKVWITRMRIAEAKRLLTYSPELTINEVASTVGFASTTSFANSFRQMEQTTPNRWRHQNSPDLHKDAS